MFDNEHSEAVKEIHLLLNRAIMAEQDVEFRTRERDELRRLLDEARGENTAMRILLKEWCKWATGCGISGEELAVGAPIYGSIGDKTRDLLDRLKRP